MKNFRKVLALVLVVATLFSFVAMTASAKDYTDADKVSYTEAVDVLTEIGILNGYTDGSYRPTNTITRAEMAKMIAVLANEGKDNIGDLYASACKFADMTGDAVWAKSYVAYCNQIGIVAGRNATTFDPYGKVTGVETAKMLLCMIGFDAKAQGYVGTNWKVNVLRDAEKVGLLENFAAGFEADKAITREESAQMMLNALKAPMVVGTVSDNIVNISNTVWLDLNGLKTTIKTITLTDAIDVYNCYILYGNVLVSNIPVWTNYAGLKVDADAQDCYGNPVTKWSYTNAYGKETWSAEYAHAYDYYYTAESTVATDLDKLGPTSSELWVDGVNKTGDYATPAALFKGVDETYSGKGVEIKVYVDPYVVINADHTATIQNKVIITVKNTYIGVVASVNNAQGTFTLSAAANSLTGATATFKNASYGFKAGDVILYWLCQGHDNGKLHDAELATPVNVDLTYVSNATAGSGYSSYITGSGKKYEYAENLGNNVAGNNKNVMGRRLWNAENLRDSSTFDLYLDKFGYIMGWKEVLFGYETGYAYLEETTGVYTPTGVTSSGELLYTATATTVDFTATPTTGDKIDEDAFDALSASEIHNGFGRLVKYSLIDGVKSLGEHEGGYTYEYGALAEIAANGSVLKTDGNLYNGANITAYGTNETQYLVRSWDYTAGKFTYKAYTEDTLPMNYLNNIVGISNDDKGDTVVANIQYFTENIAGYDALTYVFVNALYTDSTPARAYVTGKVYVNSGDVFNDVIGKYTGYEAYINGEKAILAITDAQNQNDFNSTKLPFVYEAKLTVIGLLDTENGNIPVYADLDERPTTYDALTFDTGWVYSKGYLWVYDGRGDANPAVYKPTEDFFAVVATEKTDAAGEYNFTKITDPNELNQYMEVDASGNFTFTMEGGYADATSWAVADANDNISELYLKINLAD